MTYDEDTVQFKQRIPVKLLAIRGEIVGEKYFVNQIQRPGLRQENKIYVPDKLRLSHQLY